MEPTLGRDVAIALGGIVWAFFSFKYFRQANYFKKEGRIFLPSFSLIQLLGAFFMFIFPYILIMVLDRFGVPLPLPLEVSGMLLCLFIFGGYCWGMRRSLLPYFRQSGFWLGTGSWFIIYPFVLLWSGGMELLLKYSLNYTPQLQAAVTFLKNQENPYLLALLIFFMVGIIPLMEEVLFRGFLQGWLRPHLGSKAAVVLTAFIFAFFHASSSQGLTNITIVSSLWLLGIFLGYLLEATQSLRTSIGLHATFNLVSIITIFF